MGEHYPYATARLSIFPPCVHTTTMLYPEIVNHFTIFSQIIKHLQYWAIWYSCRVRLMTVGRTKVR